MNLRFLNRYIDQPYERWIFAIIIGLIIGIITNVIGSYISNRIEERRKLKNVA